MSNNYGTGPHPAQFSPPTRRVSRNRLFALIAAGVVAVVAAVGVIWAVNRNTSEPTPSAAASTSPAVVESKIVVLEHFDAESATPFTRSLQVAPVVEFPDAVLNLIDAQLNKLTPNPDSTGLTVGGAEPGLYGGSHELAVCDVAAIGAFLSADTAKATAWADALGIPVETIPQFLQTLSPLVLLHDTAVTNHGFADGKAVPYQAILQSGTAVLVDPSGQPVVRCACGNPLAPPEPIELDGAKFDGGQWPNFAPEKVVTVEPSASDLSSFKVVDVATGELYERTIGAAAETPEAPGLLVAVGDQISTSPDGVNWTVAEGAPSALRIAYGDGLLVAIAPDGEYPDQTTLVYTSSDGITWSEPQSLPAAPADIAYTDGLWAIAGPSQSPPESGITGTIHTSTDGRTWQEKPISVPVENWEVPLDINSLSVAGGVWMIEALSYLGDSDIQTVIRSTDQGASWAVVPYQNPTTGSTFFPLGLQWGWDEKTLVAVGSQLDEVRLDGPSVFSSQAGISTDGSEWTFAPTSPAEAYFSSLTFDAGRGWIAAGRVGDYETGIYSVYGSSDLYNWTMLGTPGGDVTDVAVIPGELPIGYAPPAAGPAPTSAAPVPTSPAAESGPCLFATEGGNTIELRAVTPGSPDCATMTEVQSAASRSEGTSTGPRSIDLFIGWSCAYAPITYTEETGIAGSCTPIDASNAGYEMWVSGASTPAPTAAPPSGATASGAVSVPGDLGLSVTMTRPTCDGLGIVVVGSAVTPGSYEADIQNFLDTHPGASYLRTDQSCPSLNQATSTGNAIYAVYTVAGYDEASVRAAVCAAGDGAYGKWLDTTTDPSFQIKC